MVGPFEKSNEHDLPQPVAKVYNPASGNIENIYKNIENEPLIKKIKELEEKLEALMGKYSMQEDLDEIAEELDNKKPQINEENLSPKETTDEEIELLKMLLDDFNELLKTPYGSLGYLVKSNSEDIKKLYGIDTYRDYYYKLDGSAMKVSVKLEKMVAAGGDHRLYAAEEGTSINDPAETPNNTKVTDHVIHEIIYAIHEKLEKLQE